MQCNVLETMAFRWSSAALLLLALVQVSRALEGPNICVRQESYTTVVRVSELKAYQVRENTFCLNFPPRCSKYKMVTKTIYKNQVSLPSQFKT
ncbi:hypothetical protein B566_EDAN014656 [Ephemera danica]|nr:hypothetical protein B566_EDAN014656 [Ephemera danica]